MSFDVWFMLIFYSVNSLHATMALPGKFDDGLSGNSKTWRREDILSRSRVGRCKMV